MKRLPVYWAGISMALCACEVVETSTAEQAGMNLQGTSLLGINLQGPSLLDMTVRGYRPDGATLWGSVLEDVRVERGEVIADRGPITLRGTALVGAHLRAEVRNLATTPPTTAVVEYRITAITPESSQYDPTWTGNTFLYTLEQWNPDTLAWSLACPADLDGRSVAIPLAATWDEHGNRMEHGSLFTFGCTTGVVAKCYRWGYRPWVTGYGDLGAMHWTCTRLARADYCGNGVPHTRNGTWVNVWDSLPPPGPIQRRDPLAPNGMVFEAGWNTRGAVCLNHTRWLRAGKRESSGLCPDRVIPPAQNEADCNTALDRQGDGNARMFNESFVHF